MPQSAVHARREMMEAAARSPGVPLTHVAATLLIDYKTALHHARMLQRRGALQLDDQGVRALWPAHVPPRDPMRPALDAVARGAGAPMVLARELGITRSAAARRLDMLERRGLVRRVGATAWRVPTDEAHRLMAKTRDRRA